MQSYMTYTFTGVQTYRPIHKYSEICKTYPHSDSTQIHWHTDSCTVTYAESHMRRYTCVNRLTHIHIKIHIHTCTCAPTEILVHSPHAPCGAAAPRSISICLLQLRALHPLNTQSQVELPETSGLQTLPGPRRPTWISSLFQCPQGLRKWSEERSRGQGLRNWEGSQTAPRGSGLGPRGCPGGRW